MYILYIHVVTCMKEEEKGEREGERGGREGARVAGSGRTGESGW